jgi:hypothetical protein
VSPVVRSAFSGSESSRAKSGSSDEMRSGGGFSEPTFGSTFSMVEFVLAICGFKGFSVWYLRCSGFVSCSLAFPGLANRRTVVDRGLEKAFEGCNERIVSRNADIVLH